MAQVRSEFPRRVREVENEWVALSDGTRLATRLWLPEDAERDPVPVIIDAIPYRKGDGTAERDAARYPWFAGHGYACLRPDLRGSGDSEGVLEDEYLPQEQRDILEIIDWATAQPWCSGSAGMTGISWGGFNSLQVAALRPPRLRAIVTVMSTDDRYADDVHYIGGAVQAIDMLAWATSMLSFNALPPDPKVVGDDWRERWFNRLDQTPPWIDHWLGHQRRDAYWKQGSVCEDYAAVEAAVYAVGGWVDGYTNAVLRLLEGLPGPRKGLIGPWGHCWPEEASPGPSIGFLQECLRWWDHWLKGIDTGIMDEPMLRVWMQGWAEPRASHEERRGRWVAEEAWPSPHIETLRFSLGETHGGGLLDPAVRAGAGEQAADPGSAPRDGFSEARVAVSRRGARLSIKGLQTTGVDGGAWCGDGGPADTPPDQRSEDGASLCFTSEPLTAPLEILGFPQLTLELASDEPQALVVARLCDVAPDGASLLVTRGVLNLTHRESHEHPEPLDPGRRSTADVRLDSIAHRFEAGHRLRVAVSPTYWPLVWPSPRPATLAVLLEGGNQLRLPARPPRKADDRLRHFDPPETSTPLQVTSVAPAREGRLIERDVVTGRLTETFDWGMGGRNRLERYGIWYENTSRTVFSILPDDPLSACCEVANSSAVGRQAEGWETRADAAARMTCDAGTFFVTSTLDVYEGERCVFARTWTVSLPREHC
jgi:putative CocE/NonD family hydrolase